MDSALVSIDSTETNLYIIVQDESNYISINVDSRLKSISFSHPVKGTSFTKTFDFTVLQFIDALTKSSKNKSAQKALVDKIGYSPTIPTLEDNEQPIRESNTEEPKRTRTRTSGKKSDTGGKSKPKAAGRKKLKANPKKSSN